MALWYLLAAALVAVDQIVKYWVRSTIPLGGTMPFLPHIMDLTYTRNSGAAFSILSEHTWFLTLASVVISAALAAALARRVFPGRLGKLSLSLVLAGAVGNLIDRFLFGSVTDMFMTTFMDFAIFNVADICVTVGSVLMIVYALFFWDQGKTRGSGHDAP